MKIIEKRYLGIKNSSRASCYISSAIQLLYQAIGEKEQEELIHLSRALSSLSSSSNDVDDSHSTTSNTTTHTGKNANRLSSHDKSQNNKHDVDFLFQFGNLLHMMMFITRPDSSSNNDSDSDGEGDSGRKENMKHIDPSKLYNVLSSKIDSTIPGDASSSLRILMQFLRQSIDNLCYEFMTGADADVEVDKDADVDVDVDKDAENQEQNKKEGVELNGKKLSPSPSPSSLLLMKLLSSSSSLKESLQSTFWNGTMKHQIQGTKISNESSSISLSSSSSSLLKGQLNPNQESKIIKTIRSKSIKERPLPCIIPLPILTPTSTNKHRHGLGHKHGQNNDFITAFNSVIAKPQYIHGYDWDEIDEKEYEEEKKEVIIDHKRSNIVDDNDNDNVNCTGNENNKKEGTSELDKMDGTDVKEGIKDEKDDNDAIINNLDCLDIKDDGYEKEDKSSLASSSSSSSSSSMSSSDSDSSSTSSSDSSSLSSSSSSSSSMMITNKWITEKRTWLGDDIPKCLIFQLKRFEYKAQVKVHAKSKAKSTQNISSKMDIPNDFYLYQSKAYLNYPCDSDDYDDKSDNGAGAGSSGRKSCQSNSCLKYTLTGAIVYTDDKDNIRTSNITNLTNTDNIGHYLCYLKKKKMETKDQKDDIDGDSDGNSDVDCYDEKNIDDKNQVHKSTDEIWFKIDDEKIFPMIVHEKEAEEMPSNSVISNTSNDKNDNSNESDSGNESGSININDNNRQHQHYVKEYGTCKIISKEKLLKMLGGVNTKSGYWCAYILLYECQGTCDSR